MSGLLRAAISRLRRSDPQPDPVYGAALAIHDRRQQQQAYRRSLAQVRGGRTVEQVRADAARSGSAS